MCDANLILKKTCQSVVYNFDFTEGNYEVDANNNVRFYNANVKNTAGK